MKKGDLIQQVVRFHWGWNSGGSNHSIITFDGQLATVLEVIASEALEGLRVTALVDGVVCWTHRNTETWDDMWQVVSCDPEVINEDG